MPSVHGKLQGGHVLLHRDSDDVLDCRDGVLGGVSGENAARTPRGLSRDDGIRPTRAFSLRQGLNV